MKDGRARLEVAAAAAVCLLLLAAPVRVTAQSTGALTDYARAFHRGDYRGAADLAQARLAENADDVQARLTLARAEAALGRFDAAFAGFQEALRRAPDDPDALYYVGITAGALAQAEYERVLADAPDSARAHQLRGQTHEAQGRPGEAEAEYAAALAADPDLIEALVALGDLARADLGSSEGRLAEARSYYERALRRAPGNFDAHYGLGACDAFGGDHASAIGHYRRALEADPAAATARLALGISLLQTSQPEAAVVELEEAARLEPRMREAYFFLGRAYTALGRDDAAQFAFARARRLTREDHATRSDPEEPR